MSKFQKKRGNATPQISTASLPDIVFMLLFFFMVVTTLREAELMVKVGVPQATELVKLEQKSLVNFIYVGRPIKRYEKVYGTSPRIQLSDKIAQPNEIPLFLEKFKTSVPESMHGRIISSLRVDGGVTMGIVQDVKTQLRKSGQLKVSYSARVRTEDLK
jgi:biopolymer transport protein ExbD